MYTLIWLPYYPPSPFPGHYALFSQVLVSRSQGFEIAYTTELGLLWRPRLALRCPLVKHQDSEDLNLDI